MARVLHLVVAACAVSGSARADKTEDPRTAIEQRGLTLEAGKRHRFIIVPPATPSSTAPDGAQLNRAVVYFGDDKVLFKQRTSSWTGNAGRERLSVDDQRSVFGAALDRVGTTYTLGCWRHDASGGDRTIELGNATRSKPLAASTKLVDVLPGHEAYAFAREVAGTTYYLIDRPRTGDAYSRDFRLFIGKRGSLKRVPISEVAFDSKSDIFVTPKGTFVIEKAPRKEDEPRMSFGKAKQTELTVLPVWPNRQLIYQDLGVYARDPSGYPCDEL